VFRPYWILIPLGAAACGGHQPEPAPQPAPEPPPPPPQTVVIRDTVRVKDPELQQRVDRLEVQLLDKDAQIEQLQARLDEARQEVVRAMAKVQTSATRAEAASAMAEAELAVQTWQRSNGGQASADVGQAKRLLQLSTETFNKENYGGALYLANQAKLLAGGGRRSLSAGADPKPGESSFAAPVRLRATTRARVRQGPGTDSRVLFVLEAGATVMGQSYTDKWIRVTDQAGRRGWVARSILVRAPEGGP